MKNGILKLLLFVSLLQFGCMSKSTKAPLDGNCIEVDIATLPEKNMLFANNEPLNCRFVKLETTDECLVGFIQKMLIVDSLIFLKDNNDNLFVFNPDGSFRCKIGTRGNAKNEYVSLGEFYLDEKERTVNVCDVVKSKIVSYDFDGKFVGTKTIEQSINTYFTYSEDVVMLDDEIVLVKLSTSPFTFFNYVALDKHTFREVESYFPYHIKSPTNMSGPAPRVSIANKSYFTSVLLSDTIYSYHQGDYQKRFVVKQEEEKHVTNKVIEEYHSEGMELFDLMRLLKNNGYSLGLSEIFATENHLLFSVYKYRVICDLSTNQFYKEKYIYSNKAYASNYFYTTTKDAFVSHIQAIQLLELDKDDPYVKKNSELQDIIRRTTEEDNPIIVFYYVAPSE